MDPEMEARYSSLLREGGNQGLAVERLFGEALSLPEVAGALVRGDGRSPLVPETVWDRAVRSGKIGGRGILVPNPRGNRPQEVLVTPEQVREVCRAYDEREVGVVEAYLVALKRRVDQNEASRKAGLRWSSYAGDLLSRLGEQYSPREMDIPHIAHRGVRTLYLVNR